MPKASQPSEIRLTGRVVDIDHEESVAISPGEADEYERNGYSVFEGSNFTIASRDLVIEDGTIAVAPKLDASGRSAVAGRHTDRAIRATSSATSIKAGRDGR